MKLSASEFTMKSISGQAFGPDNSTSFREEKLDDNSVIQSMVQERRGKIDNHLLFLRGNYSNYLDALSEGCEADGKDWATRGTSIVIEDYLNDSAAEGINTRLAYDQLIKFDDVFFEPSGVRVTKYGYQGLRDEETQTILSQNNIRFFGEQSRQRMDGIIRDKNRMARTMIQRCLRLLQMIWFSTIV